MGDLKYMLSIAVFAVLWTAFLGFFTINTLQEINLDANEQEEGIFGAIKSSTAFLNPFSDVFRSDIMLISIMVFSVILFGIVVVSVRFIRGQ